MLITKNTAILIKIIRASPAPTFPVVFLYNPTPAVGDNFGYAVAMSGDRLVVGTPYDDIGATDAGSAYLYDLSGATPAVPTAILAHPSLAATDRFGYAVAVSGTRMVVGAIRDDTGATDAGRVYVYDLAGTNPNAPMLTLNNPAPKTMTYSAGRWESPEHTSSSGFQEKTFKPTIRVSCTFLQFG